MGSLITLFLLLVKTDTFLLQLLFLDLNLNLNGARCKKPVLATGDYIVTTFDINETVSDRFCKSIYFMTYLICLLSTRDNQ